MEKKLNELNKLYSDTERDIAKLKLELKQSEFRKKKLQEEAMYYVAKICPDYYKKIFGGHSKNVLDPVKSGLEDMFVNQNALCKDIFGYSFTIRECSYEEVDNILLKKWEIEGEVGENSFIVQFVSEIALDQAPEEAGQTENFFAIRGLEIFPHSYGFEALAAKLMELEHGLGLRALIPCLYTYQTLQKERDGVQERLAANKSIVTSEEAGTLVITMMVDSIEFKIEWDIKYRDRGLTYFNVISIKTETEEVEVMRLFQNHSCWPYLKGDEPLMDGSDVLKFIENIFQEK